MCLNYVSASVTQTDLDTWNRAIIGSENLQPNFALPSNIKGSYQVKFDRITPLGSQAQGNYTLFSAKSYFKVDLVLWTEIRTDQAVSATEVWSYSDWLQLDTTTDFFTGAWSNYRYAVDWKKYSGLTVRDEAKGFEGAISMNPTLVDLTPSVLDFGNTQINVVAKQFYATKAQVSILSSTPETIGNYASIAAPIGSTTISVSDVNTDRATPGSKGGQKAAELSAYLANIGVFRQAQYDVTMQQGATTCPCVGATDILTNGIRVTIIPDIKKTIEPLSVKNQRIRVDTTTGFLGASGACVDTTTNPLETTTVSDRPIKWTVENKAMKISMTVEMNLYSLCEVTPVVDDEEIPTLDIPTCEINDQLWDNTLGGQTGIQQNIDTTDPVAAWFKSLWANYWYLFVIAIIIAVGITVFYVNNATGGLLSNYAQNKVREQQFKQQQSRNEQIQREQQYRRQTHQEF